MYCTNALRLERGCQKLKQLHGKITTKTAGLSTSKETIKDLKLYCFFRLGTPVFLLPNQHHQSIKSYIKTAYINSAAACAAN